MFGRRSYWANPKDLERAVELSKVKTDLIVIDTAHGHTQKVLNMIRKIKQKLKNCTLCAGNIATGKAAKFLADSGVDIVKVGICPGSICMTLTGRWNWGSAIKCGSYYYRWKNNCSCSRRKLYMKKNSY